MKHRRAALSLVTAGLLTVLLFKQNKAFVFLALISWTCSLLADPLLGMLLAAIAPLLVVWCGGSFLDALLVCFCSSVGGVSLLLLQRVCSQFSVGLVNLLPRSMALPFVVATELALIPAAVYAVFADLAIGHSWDTACIVEPGPLVFLIHGSGFNQGQWISVRPMLASHGIRNIRSCNYLIGNSLNIRPCPGQDIPEFAEIAAARISSAMAESSATSVILIGHSMGGLVASFIAVILQPKKLSLLLLAYSCCSPRTGEQPPRRENNHPTRSVRGHSIRRLRYTDVASFQ
jgi:hypothetical protein